MNRLRIVKISFPAKCYAAKPSRMELLKEGQLIVFRRHQDGHFLYVRASDPKGKEPFIIDADTLNANTEEIQAKD